MKALRLASMIRGLPAYFSSIQPMVASMGRVYSQLMSPRAKKFFERSASRGLTPASRQTSVVIDVIGTSYTVYADSEPSLRGLDS